MNRSSLVFYLFTSLPVIAALFAAHLMQAQAPGASSTISSSEPVRVIVPVLPDDSLLPISRLVVRPDGLLVIPSEEGVKAHLVPGGGEFPAADYSRAAFSPSGHEMIVQEGEDLVRYKLAPAPLERLHVGTEPRQVQYFPDGGSLVSIAERENDFLIEWRDARTLAIISPTALVIEKTAGTDSQVRVLAMRADEHRKHIILNEGELSISMPSWTTRVIDLEHGREMYRLAALDDGLDGLQRVTAAAFSADGLTIETMHHQSGSQCRFERLSGLPLGCREGRAGERGFLSEDGRIGIHSVEEGEATTVLVWDGNLERSITVPGYVLSVQFGADGRLAFIYYPNSIDIFDVHEGEAVGRLAFPLPPWEPWSGQWLLGSSSGQFDTNMPLETLPLELSQGRDVISFDRLTERGLSRVAMASQVPGLLTAVLAGQRSFPRGENPSTSWLPPAIEAIIDDTRPESAVLRVDLRDTGGGFGALHLLNESGETVADLRKLRRVCRRKSDAMSCAVPLKLFAGKLDEDVLRIPPVPIQVHLVAYDREESIASLPITVPFSQTRSSHQTPTATSRPGSSPRARVAETSPSQTQQPPGLRLELLPATGQSGINVGAYSDDGRLILTGGAGDAVLWDAESGQMLRRLGGGLVHAVALLPGQQGAITVDKTMVSVWDIFTGRLRLSFAHQNTLLNEGGEWMESNDGKAVPSPDGRFLFLHLGTGPATIWKLDSGAAHYPFSSDERFLSWSMDGTDHSLLVTATETETRVIEMGSLHAHQSLDRSLQQDPVGGLFSDNGQGLLQVWTLSEGRLVPGLRFQLQGEHRYVGISSDGDRIMIAEQQRVDDNPDKDETDPEAREPDGQFEPDALGVYDTATGERVSQIPHQRFIVEYARTSHPRQWLRYSLFRHGNHGSSIGQTIEVVDLDRGEVEDAGRCDRSLRFGSSDGRFKASCASSAVGSSIEHLELLAQRENYRTAPMFRFRPDLRSETVLPRSVAFSPTQETSILLSGEHPTLWNFEREPEILIRPDAPGGALAGSPSSPGDDALLDAGPRAEEESAEAKRLSTAAAFTPWGTLLTDSLGDMDTLMGVKEYDPVSRKWLQRSGASSPPDGITRLNTFGSQEWPVKKGTTRASMLRIQEWGGPANELYPAHSPFGYRGFLVRSYQRSGPNEIPYLLSPDGSLWLGDAGGVNSTRDGTSRCSIETIGDIGYGTHSFVFAPTGRYLAGTRELKPPWTPGQGYRSATHLLMLWDTRTCLPTHEFPKEGDITQSRHSIAFSPRGDRLVAGGTDGTVFVWEVPSGRPLAELKGHRGPVESVSLSSSGSLAVSLGVDGTTRLWDVERQLELCKLFTFPDGSWAVIDPEGRYDASNGGDVKGLHFVLGIEPIELQQLKERYYEPGLLAKTLGRNPEPLRQVGAFTTPGLYPSIQLTLPDPNDPVLNIRLTNRGGGIGRVAVLIDGKEVIADARRQEEDPNAPQLELLVPLNDNAALAPGQKNRIEVFAFNAEGYLSSRRILLEYEAPAGVSGRGVMTGRVVNTTAAPPHLWAIVCGVSDYSGTAIDLRYPSKDARDFAHALNLAAGKLFGPERVHITLLASPEDPAAPDDNAAAGQTVALEPTRLNLREALEAARKAAPSDIVLIYLAGHGVSWGGAEGDFHYLTREASSANLEDPQVRQTTTVSSLELTDWINQVPARKQVLLLDTCSSGRLVEKLAGQHVGGRAVPASQVRSLDRMKDRTGMFVLAGAASDAVSYEASRFSQGLLTYSLLSGMAGQALRQDGAEQFVDVSKLLSFAVNRVPELAREIGGVQRPILSVPRGGQPFDLGVMGAEERKAIAVANPLPMVVRSSFQDERHVRDHLDLSDRINGVLQDKASSGRNAPMVYVDAASLEGAWQLVGRYAVEKGRVRVSGSLFKGSGTKPHTSIRAEGSLDDSDALAKQVVDRALEAIQLAEEAR